MKTKNAQFLLACHYFCGQSIIISLEYADFYAKISLILDSAATNSVTQRTLLKVAYCSLKAFWRYLLPCLQAVAEMQLVIFPVFPRQKSYYNL